MPNKDNESKNSYKQVMQRLAEFTEARDWRRWHDPKNLAMAIASEAGELAGVLRWVSSDDANLLCKNKTQVAEDLESEIADVGIFLLMLCENIDKDFFELINKKMDKNDKRFEISS